MIQTVILSWPGGLLLTRCCGLCGDIRARTRLNEEEAAERKRRGRQRKGRRQETERSEKGWVRGSGGGAGGDTPCHMVLGVLIES